MFCEKCGTEISDKAKFCDACGAQTADAQAAIQAEKEKNMEAHLDKTMSGSISITVAMVLFSLFFIIFFGLEEGESRVVTITAIAFSVFICGIKWYYEIKNQRKWKKEAEENAKGSDNHVL